MSIPNFKFTNFRGQLVVGWLAEWVDDTDVKMAPAQIVLDYNFEVVDKLIVDAIKKIGDVEQEEYKENVISEN
jgi:hypothetical protein